MFNNHRNNKTTLKKQQLTLIIKSLVLNISLSLLNDIDVMTAN